MSFWRRCLKHTTSALSACRKPLALHIIYALDFALIMLMAVVAKIVYVDLVIGDHRSTSPHLAAGALCALVATLFLYENPIGTGRDTGRPVKLLVILGLAFACTISIGYLAKIAVAFSRGWLVLWFALAFGALLITQSIRSPLVSHLRQSGALRGMVGVVGVSGRARSLISSLAPATQDFRPFALPGARPEGVQTFDELIDLARQGLVQEVIVIDDFSEQAASATKELLSLPVNLRLACDRYTYELPARRVVMAGPIGLLEIAERPIGSWGALLKRGLDITVSSTALVLLTPLLLGIALAIKLESVGPVIFRQRRLGLAAHPFHLWKFRTMTVLEDGPELRQATTDDPRTTRVGRFLRRTSLDELPQLVNVLRGDMSLVGPRPHAVAHDKLYGELLARYTHRLRVSPGMTGWAQIHGFRGPTHDPSLMAERVRYDIEYIENWSIWLDLEILLLTPFYGFVSRNAI